MLFYLSYRYTCGVLPDAIVLGFYYPAHRRLRLGVRGYC